MSIFSKLFGNTSEKRDTSYTGPRPATSLLGVTGGKEYYDEILNRMQGRGVGFGNTYASQYSSPIINNMRANYEGYTLPELESELSATGRRRGSGGFQQIARSRLEQGLAEGDVFSRLQQRNEDQQRAEINAAIEDMGGFARSNADLLSNYANFENNQNAANVAQENQRRANAAENNKFLMSGATSAILGMGGTGSSTYPYSYMTPGSYQYYSFPKNNPSYSYLANSIQPRYRLGINK